MNRILTTAACSALLFVVSPAFSQKAGTPKSSKMSSAEYQRTIVELSSPDYRTRVAATERLAKRGKSAKADLSKLAKHGNAEVRSRATQLLVRLEPVKKPSSHHIASESVVFLGGGDVVFGEVGIALGEIEIIELADGAGEIVEAIEIVDGVVEVAEEVIEEIEEIEGEAESLPRAVRRVADDIREVDVAKFLKELKGTADD